jgi:AcrR family transcriptional regulator
MTVPSKRRQNDGRYKRRVRTRATLIGTYLSLLEQGVQQPSAAQIARTAKTSVRTVFDHFFGLSELEAAAVGHAVEEHSCAPIDGHKGEGKPERLLFYVEGRAANCERWLQRRLAWQSLQRAGGTNRAARASLEALRQRSRARLADLFAPELAPLPEATALQKLGAMEMVTSVDAWAYLRECSALSYAEASDLWRSLLDCILSSSKDMAGDSPAALGFMAGSVPVAQRASGLLPAD